MTVRGRMQALIALGAGFNPTLTGRENIYVNASILGIHKAEVDRRLDSIVDFAGIPEFIDSPVQTYSSGMIVRLGFAVTAHLEPDILLVDEVLAVGDEGFQVKCLNKIGELKMNGTAIVLVSHNMHTVSTYSNRVLVQGPPARTSCSATCRPASGRTSAWFTRRWTARSRSDAPARRASTSTASRFRKRTSRWARTSGCACTTARRFPTRTSSSTSHCGSPARSGWHYQATNAAFGTRVDLAAGQGWLELTVEEPARDPGRRALLDRRVEPLAQGAAVLVADTGTLHDHRAILRDQPLRHPLRDRQLLCPRGQHVVLGSGPEKGANEKRPGLRAPGVSCKAIRES